MRSETAKAAYITTKARSTLLWLKEEVERLKERVASLEKTAPRVTMPSSWPPLDPIKQPPQPTTKGPEDD